MSAELTTPFEQAASASSSSGGYRGLTTLPSTGPPLADPFGTPTYRHLLSAGSLTPLNPLRVVAHCDVDAAYAQFEARRLGIDSFEIPVAVQQWSGLIAISYAARKFGISRHADVEAAKKLCPELVLVHVQTIAPGAKQADYNDKPRPETHKVSLDPYRRESRKILDVFKRTCPLGAVEKASIDESYFDLTLEVRKLILSRYPHLQNAPTKGKGIDEPLPPPPTIDWEGRGELVPVKSIQGGERKEEQEEEEDMDERPTWTDVALAHGAELMANVRRAVLSELGYTTSGGIASNKTLAKLCSGYKKPNAQTTLLPRAVPGYLKTLPVSKIRFLGGKLGRALAETWDAETVGDLWSVPRERMQAHFGPDAAWVHAVIRGVDHSPVNARIANKTMLASKNLRPPIRARHEAHTWLEMLATELVVRLRELWEDEASFQQQGSNDAGAEDKMTVSTLWPKMLVLRFIRAQTGPRARQAPFPSVKNLEPEHVLRLAEKLWNEACDDMGLDSGQTVTRGSSAEVVTIALGFSGLERGETGQKTIDGFFGGAAAAASATKRKRLEEGEKTEDEDESGRKEPDNQEKFTTQHSPQGTCKTRTILRQTFSLRRARRRQSKKEKTKVERRPKDRSERWSRIIKTGTLP
ncbi:DNA/RNA polymerase [Acaromyces ingoldii]|uniref:DNA polymerase eta n=1 Tax=Acaromyces ingoldii TaxID=215250 RepID=A0A316YE68_9BASI|nr:DNA/RNA polymerase [Acaromyces ingoldii]PWN87519.1 DNA/RNA polymerase [Acaromyces ingoldii]